MLKTLLGKYEQVNDEQLQNIIVLEGFRLDGLQMATSRLSCVSIETCADEVDFQVDLRLT